MARTVLDAAAMLVSTGHRPWAIILAGGEGTRLAPLTRALYGIALPKQFAVLAGRRSLLQATVERILPLVPAERILVVASVERAELARQQLAEWNVELMIQPRNLDTGPGLLLPLARIRQRDRAARVVVLPADHHVAHPAPMLETIERAVGASALPAAALSLLGAAPDAAETDYGWIVPGKRLAAPGFHAVDRFVEKPESQVAERLYATKALWNTFIMVGTVERFWALAKAHLPLHTACLAAGFPQDRAAMAPRQLVGLYATLPSANFSREVLERADKLAVVPLVGAGWSDWGTPRRVFEGLRGSPELDQLLARIRHPVPAAEVAVARAKNHRQPMRWAVPPAGAQRPRASSAAGQSR